MGSILRIVMVIWECTLHLGTWTLKVAVGSKKLEYGCGVIYAGLPSFFGLALEDGHIPTFWRLL